MIVRPLNVATPETAFTVSVPPTPAGDDDIVIAAVELVTGFPPESSTVTETLERAEPAVPLDGVDVNANCAATPLPPGENVSQITDT